MGRQHPVLIVAESIFGRQKRTGTDPDLPAMLDPATESLSFQPTSDNAGREHTIDRHSAQAMKLPAANRVFVPPEKLRDYLLSTSHPVGRFKARFFKSLGYTNENWPRLESDLRELAARGEALMVEQSRYGHKFELRGRLEGPSGKSGEVVTVWIILVGHDVPRFVTAYPGEMA